MNSLPLVSVVIPTYNRESFIAEAIESVLQDSYRPVEIIVVDDGSTDATAKKIEQFSHGVQYVFQPNAGAAVARNTGVSLARGDYLAFLDSDDLWVNNKLTLQMNAFRNDSELQAVFGYLEEFYEEETKNKMPPRKLPGYALGAMLIKIQNCRNIGQFRSDLQIGDTVEWLSRLFESDVKKLLLDEVVLKRRIHGGNIGVHKQHRRIEYVWAMKSLLDRKRNKISNA